MRPWTCRVFGLAAGLAGALLIILVLRAIYVGDRTGQALMFALGMPLVLLSTLAGGLLLRLSGKLLSRTSLSRTPGN
jgi:hypothetical protein